MDKYNITTLAVTETPDTEEIIGIISIHHIIEGIATAFQTSQ